MSRAPRPFRVTARPIQSDQSLQIDLQNKVERGRRRTTAGVQCLMRSELLATPGPGRAHGPIRRAADVSASRRAGCLTPAIKSAQSSNLPVLHMSLRAPACEKWRRAPDLAGQTPREAAVPGERKVWQPGLLQSNAVGREHGEMALWVLEKGAIFRRSPPLSPRFSPDMPRGCP